ncbi:MAG: methionine synthase [Candidatus Melainabacteria bacterium]|nr:methionine synthase [Candidatus Melainabacteria bacterium]
MAKNFLDLCKEKIVIFDGAMGTSIQDYPLSLDDFEGKEGCNEILINTKPEVIKEIHASFLNVGCDVIETNSFGASSIVLAEYDIPDKTYELNFKSAKLAKEIALSFNQTKHRFVAGSIGPTTKLPTLGHISYRKIKEAFYTQASGLLDGGVDLFLIETCQDILQAKAAVAAVFKLMEEKKKRIPVIVQITIERTGTMLVGSDIATAFCALEPYEIDVIGMNCATGPLEMSDHIRHLCEASSFHVSCIPNAGIPENVGGKSHYHLSPHDFAKTLFHFVNDLGVSIVGGCCGTTPEHLKALINLVGNSSPKKRTPKYTNSVSSLYNSVPLVINPPPIIVGERTNANGSKLFRELLGKEDFDSMINMAKEQLEEGAHLLDVCTAYVGRDEVKDMTEYIRKLNIQVNIPLMIDSTEAPVIEKSLELTSGKALINSINLEDGEERMKKVCPLAKEFGAAVVALTIDEDGMAKTGSKKFEIAKRIYELATKKYKIAGKDLIFDTLTFTLGSGDEDFRKAGIETIEGIKLIKKSFPEVKTMLGISNISFGLAPPARQVLNSIFMHEAVANGLDLAIVNARKILPLFKIPASQREVALDLVYDRRKENYDPLHKFMSLFEDIKKQETTEIKVSKSTLSIEENLKSRIIDGNKSGVNKDLDEALKKYKPLDIINNILLDGMKVVGDLFASGEMQLPFVLQSAETMKAAVAYLEPFMEKEDVNTRGKMVIATVKGDVHDIGKNLVDIILTNNGYKVFNLGIKQPVENIIKTALEEKVDVIGMSGLLVKSTQIMKENLEILNERNITIPVILGGAALNRRFVEEDCQSTYKGKVFYGSDAFSDLRFMEDIFQNKAESKKPTTIQKPLPKVISKVINQQSVIGSATITKSPLVKPAEKIPTIPFYGAKVLKDIKLDEIYPYINETALMVGQWQFKRGKLTPDTHKQLLIQKAYPVFEDLKKLAKEKVLLTPQIVYGYYYCLSDGNDLIILKEDKKSELLRFTFPRQKDRDRLCLTDFFTDKNSSSKEVDVVAFHVVTVGQKASDYAKELFEANQYTDYLYFHGFGVETAEALAEWSHKKIRTEMNIHQSDAKETRKLLGQGYQGSRYSFGYPACPYLEDQTKIFELLKPDLIGISLSESYQLQPEQSTSAIIVHHSQAKYFNVS